MQSNAENTRRDDAFPSPDGPQPGTDRATTTTNLDTGEIEPLTNTRDEDDDSLSDLGNGSDGGSAGDGSAA